MKRRQFITTVALFGASGIAGCGGDDDTETPTETTNTDATTTSTGTESDETTTAPDATTTAPDETGTDGNQDLGDPPAELISLSSTSLPANRTTTLSGTLSNPYLFDIQSVEVSIGAPNDDWTVTATGNTSFDSIEQGGSEDVSWEVTVPEGASGDVTLPVSVSYESATDSADLSLERSITVLSPVETSLIAHYPLDGSEPTDASGNGYDATIDGDIATDATGVVDGAYEFTSEVSIVDLPEFSIDTTGASIAMWVNADSWPSERAQLAYWGDDPPNFELTVNGGQADVFYWNGSRPVRGPGPTDVTVPTGEWVHYAATYNHATGTWRIYLDGEEVHTTEDRVNMNFTGSQSRLGNHPAAGTNIPRQFIGRMDDVRFYRGALSQSTIQDLADQSADE